MQSVINSFKYEMVIKYKEQQHSHSLVQFSAF